MTNQTVLKSRIIFAFFLLFLIVFTAAKTPLAATAVPGATQESSPANADELKIAEDRDKAILEAVNGFSKNSGGLLKSKKVDLKEAEKTDKWQWSKLVFWRHDTHPGPKSEIKAAHDTPAAPQKLESAVKLADDSKNVVPPQSPTITIPETVKKSEDQGKQSKKKSRISSSEFFSKPEQSPNFEEVKKKRTKRLRQLPGIDPDTVNEMITETKIQMKKEFVGAGQHNLQSVIQRAISVHLPAQIAHERIVLAERRILKAFRDFLPSADLSTSHKDGTISSGPYQHDDWRVNLRQPLFKGGVLWNTFQVEMANREVSKKELESTINEIVAEASQAYFEYERAWNVVRDKETLLGIATKMKDISDQKIKANLVSEIEKLNMDSLFGQAQYEIETAKQDLELAKLELQKVLELEIGDTVEVMPVIKIDESNPEIVEAPSDSAPAPEINSGSPAFLNIEGKDLQHFIDMAYVYRPDLQVEAAKLRAARLSHKISLGKHLPEADMIVEFGKLGEAFEGTDLRFQGDLETTEPRLKTEWRIGTELSWKLGGNTLGYTFDHDQRAPSVSQFQSAQGPISDTHTFTMSVLDNLNSLAELKETKIAALEQVLELENKERDAIREIKEAYFNYNKAHIQAESVYKKMRYRERLRKLAEHRHSVNEIQVSEYLQAEMDYDQERGALYRALADFYLAKVNLNRAIGIRDYLKIEPSEKGSVN